MPPRNLHVIMSLINMYASWRLSIPAGHQTWPNSWPGCREQDLEAITFSSTKPVTYDTVKSLAPAIQYPHVPHLALD